MGERATGRSLEFFDFLDISSIVDFFPMPAASRFLSDSFFSRCSRAGARDAREGASGLSGEEIVGVWSSSRVLFWGIEDGVVPLGEF